MLFSASSTQTHGAAPSWFCAPRSVSCFSMTISPVKLCYRLHFYQNCRLKDFDLKTDYGKFLYDLLKCA
jgi:hypothetical protein